MTYTFTEEHRENLRLARLGKRHSEETKRKISESNKRVWEQKHLEWEQMKRKPHGDA